MVVHLVVTLPRPDVGTTLKPAEVPTTRRRRLVPEWLVLAGGLGASACTWLVADGYMAINVFVAVISLFNQRGK
ncbi:hypothetical protein IU436_30535 [Nocardia farcinica]|uniref:hypothetical protein n=1 Tax=Nocardia farcinica TaxID=37329 RepID=UPI001894E5C7|nr:hypothetical protein [Nocardia farcinica]MBF6422918.1 hypothetical protein [Nocardia farcinica]MBF6434648.1 hypothetical protein [Nocardia farcinica]MBF6505754.1 hypothetical protein [Nocardia farcinica]